MEERTNFSHKAWMDRSVVQHRRCLKLGKYHFDKVGCIVPYAAGIGPKPISHV